MRKTAALLLAASLAWSAPVLAQQGGPADPTAPRQPRGDFLGPATPRPRTDPHEGLRPLTPQGPGLQVIPGDRLDLDQLQDDRKDAAKPAEEAKPEEPPLSRPERMDKLFADLAATDQDSEAQFIAEEIEALWRDSGSPTVDLLTDRATDALEMGDKALARELIDGAIELGPEHAEAWAESARIALAEEKVGEALEHIEKAVALEPRHYYALTELGVILEELDQPQGAYDAYSKALELNPRLPEAREGAERTEREAKGRSL